MDQDDSVSPPFRIQELGRKSWTAYVGLAVSAVLVLIIGAALIAYGYGRIGAVLLLLAAPIILYKILVLRSYKLYCNDIGVWISSGILPWNSGVRGVKWRDLDEAIYFQTFWSWLFKSYSIRIAHRFTKSSEIFLTHIARGHECVIEVNAKHQELVRNGGLS